jgi:hypothetical protein
MRSGMLHKAIWLISILSATALLLIGCTPPAEAPGMISRNPFSLRTEGEDGIFVEWSGNSAGHAPGGESAFEIRLVNRGDQTWSGEYCFQLLDMDEVLTTFEQSEFNLEPGDVFSTPLWVLFPEELVEGSYGLALVITERMASTVTIYLGDTLDEASGPWALPVCP